jgi:heat shock protein HspQ
MHSTYVAEQNLEPDDSLKPIVHPLIGQFFSKLENGKYIRNEPDN